MPVGTAVAIGGSALVGAAATTSAANSNRRAAESTAASNNATQLQIYNQNRDALSPFMQGGLRSFDAWQALMGLSPTGPATPSGAGAGGGQTGGGAIGGAGGISHGGYQTGGSGLIGNLLSPTPGNNPTGLPSPIQNDVSVLSQGSPGHDLNALLSPSAMTDKGLANPTMTATGTDQSLINGGPNAQPINVLSQGYQANVNAPSGDSPFARAYDNYRNATGYQFRLNEGNRNALNAFANSGNLDSGAAQRAMLQFGQDYATNDFSNYLAQLMGGAQLGAGSAGALAGVGTSYANAVNANNNASLNARIGANNAMAGGINDLAGSAAGMAGYLYGNGGFGRPSAYQSSTRMGAWG